MASASFTPYWRQIDESLNPYSFVFFVVARIAGRHRPIAVVSSRASANLDGSMQGFPLIIACQRIITIFADKTNHTAIRAELALATGYYVRDEDHKEYHPEPVELLENTHGYRQPRLEFLPWDHTSVREFPFVSSCLLQGVAFDPHDGYCYQATPEPLGSVYHDTSAEWGMVVVDITELDEVRYGIVSFASAPMKWASSREDILRQRGPGIHMANESGGVFRVVDQIRSRVVMSAAEYLAKFNDQYITPEHKNITKLLAAVPLVHSDALEIIWPAGLDDEVALANVDLSKGIRKSLHEQAIRSLLQSTIDNNNFDVSIFDDVRKVPNFKEMLRLNLLQYSTRLGNTRSAGLLLRLAFDNGEHLSLECLNDISAVAILAAVDVPEMGKISSLSLCISSIRDLSIELIKGLSQSESLREIYFMQSPFRENDTPDWQLFEALSAQTSFLSRMKVVFAGSYSAALRKNFWLPTIPKKTSTSIDPVQVAPLSIFPIQQILIRYQSRSNGNIEFKTGSVYLGDSLLGPERFAAGFLTYLQTLSPGKWDINSSARLFSFSSAPASLSTSTLVSAEISPILAESFALGDDLLPDNISPKIRDLVPNGWTVLISSESRYALVRARKQIIEVENPPLTPPGPDMLEVVGLKEFLAIAAPEVDLEPLDQRPGQGILPNIEPLSVLDHEAAADLLLRCLKDAGTLNQNLRIAMEENPGGQPWYPELLQKRTDAE